MPRDQGPDISIMVELVMANTLMFDSTFPGLKDLDSYVYTSSSSDSEDAESYQSREEEKKEVKKPRKEEVKKEKVAIPKI